MLEAERLGFFRKKEVVPQKVKAAEYRYHPADIKICHKHKSKRDNEQQPFSFVDKLFNAAADYGKIYQSVQPHGIHKLYYHVGHKAVHDRENQGGVGGSPLSAPHIPTERDGSRADFKHLHEKQSVHHVGAGEKHYNNRERACKVVGKNADSFARKVSAPAVDEAAVAPESVPQILIIVNILTVKVEHKHGFVPERI